MKSRYDIIIVGAGPAGLSTAISAVQNAELNILILEKQNKPGNRIRGETLRHDKFLEDNIFHPGFFDQIAVNKTNRYKFYSPSTRKFLEIEALQERYMIEWDKLIGYLVDKAIKNKIELQVNHDVTDILFKDDSYTKVKVFDGFNELSIESDILILADGCENSLINKYGFQSPKINCPILKIIAENVNFEENVIELLFNTSQNIPGVLSIFPRSENSAEANYVQFIDIKDSDIRKSWEKIYNDAPVFSDRFKNASITYFDITTLPFGGPDKEVLIPKSRMFLTGDNAGHVEATGGSGLVSSMTMGYEIGKIASEICKSENIDEKFSEENKKILLKRIRKVKTFKNLKSLAQIGVTIRQSFFQTLGTEEKIDEKWDTIIAPSLKNAAEFF